MADNPQQPRDWNAFPPPPPPTPGQPQGYPPSAASAYEQGYPASAQGGPPVPPPGPGFGLAPANVPAKSGGGTAVAWVIGGLAIVTIVGAGVFAAVGPGHEDKQTRARIVKSYAGETDTAPSSKPAAGVTTDADSGAGMALGDYQCWLGKQPAGNMNFSVTGANAYQAPDGTMGTYTVAAGSGTVTWKGYEKDAIPAGFRTEYTMKSGRPTIHIWSPRGNDSGSCEHQ